jgi:rhodanese-related sulfurtransferase
MMKTRIIVLLLAVMMLLCGSVLAVESPIGIIPATHAKNFSALIEARDLAIIAKHANDFFTATNGKCGERVVLASNLNSGVNDPTKADNVSDYYIIDLREPTDYDAGHIKGAVNINLMNLTKPDTLKTLPTDMPILTVCYTGFSGTFAAAILDIMGYDAYPLRFGMTAWQKSTPTVVWSATEKQDITGGNYPVVTGTQP